MLWYKAWRESRARFLAAAIALVVLAVAFILSARTTFPPPELPKLPYTAFVYGNIWNPGPRVFVFVALVLGLGGLRRERAHATSALTLALPVSRLQLTATRALVGLLELAVLALIPALVIPTLSPLVVNQTYPLLHALKFGALFLSWGAVCFAVGFLWSTVLAGEYTATVACVLTPLAYIVVYANVSQGGRRFPSANPFEFMSTAGQVAHNGRGLLLDPLPWATMLILVTVAAGILFAAARVTKRQNF